MNLNKVIYHINDRRNIHLSKKVILLLMSLFCVCFLKSIHYRKKMILIFLKIEFPQKVDSCFEKLKKSHC